MSERLDKIKQKQWSKIREKFDKNIQLYGLWLSNGESIFISNRTVVYNDDKTGFKILINNQWREVLYSEIITFGFGTNQYQRKKK